MKIALGTVQLGLAHGIANQDGQVSREEAKTIISLARSLGVDTLDTAIDYGTSETLLGNLGVKDYRIITKIPSLDQSSGEVYSQIREHVLKSLRNMKIPKLYGLLLHRPDEILTPIGPAIWRALNALKEQDLVEKIGYSIYSPGQLDAIYGSYPADIVQAPYNVVDRRICSSGWLEKLNTKGVEVHVRSVFLQGLLLMSSNKRPKKFNEWSNLWNSWEHWLKLNSYTPLEGAIKFVLSNKHISRVVVGVDNANQLMEIIEATKADSPPIYPQEFSSECERLINPLNWDFL